MGVITGYSPRIPKSPFDGEHRCGPSKNEIQAITVPLVPQESSEGVDQCCFGNGVPNRLSLGSPYALIPCLLKCVSVLEGGSMAIPSSGLRRKYLCSILHGTGPFLLCGTDVGDMVVYG